MSKKRAGRFARMMTAILMAVGLLFGAAQYAEASAGYRVYREGGVTWTVPASEAATFAAGVQLLPPQNLAWGHNFSAEFDTVPEAEGSYHVYLFHRSGNRESLILSANYIGIFEARAGLMLANLINESGYYRFAVSSMYDWDSPLNSEFVSSPVIEYIRPAQALATPANLEWTPATDGFYVSWDSCGDAQWYYVSIYIDGAQWGGIIQPDNSFQIDPAWDWFRDEGDYHFTVRAVSGNLNEIANSVLSAPSPVRTVGQVDFGVPPTGVPAVAGSAAAMFALSIISAALWGVALKPKKR